MTCVSKSLSDLDAELLDEALLADEGREGVDRSFVKFLLPCNAMDVTVTYSQSQGFE